MILWYDDGHVPDGGSTLLMLGLAAPILAYTKKGSPDCKIDLGLSHYERSPPERLYTLLEVTSDHGKKMGTMPAIG